MTAPFGRAWWLGGLGFVAATSVWAQPVPVQRPALVQAAPQAAVPMIEPANQTEREVAQLLHQLNALSEPLVREAASPNVWKYQLQQGDVLLQLAVRSKGNERTHFVRMAIDTYYSAVLSSPANEPVAVERLASLPGLIQQHFAGVELYATAALKGVRAQHTRQLLASTGSSAPADEALAQRLLAFAQQYPKSQEATPAIQEAARVYQSLGKKDESIRCQRLLAEQHPGTPAARSARQALRQIGGIDGEVIPLKLPLLYAATSETEAPFDLKDLQAESIVLFFWSSETAGMAEAFDAVKRATDRFRASGLHVVYVCMDADPSRAREYLSGRLLTGTHVVLRDGLKSSFAERYGLETLPEAMLLGKDRSVKKPSLSPTQLETALAVEFPAVRRGR